MGGGRPAEPVIFLKPSTSVVGRGTRSPSRRLTREVDHEAELAVAIGRLAARSRCSDALSHVLGATAANDVTARDLQENDGQWTRAKGLDTFCPLGPVDRHRPRPRRPRGRAGRMARCVSSPARAISSRRARADRLVSAVMTLLPGDVLLTGTPAGVGPQGGRQTGVGERERASARSSTRSFAVAEPRDRCASVWRRRRRATRTSARRTWRCSTWPSPASRAGSSCCGSRTPTARATSRQRAAALRHALARARLGRGPRHGRAVRAVPAVRAPRDLPAHVDRLLADGHAYHCWCSTERLVRCARRAEGRAGHRLRPRCSARPARSGRFPATARAGGADAHPRGRPR